MAQYSDCTVGDVRTFSESDYYLLHNFVDSFERDVKSKQQDSCSNGSGISSSNGSGISSSNSSSSSTSNGNSLSSEDDAQLLSPSHCHENWKAAAADEKKAYVVHI